LREAKSLVHHEKLSLLASNCRTIIPLKGQFPNTSFKFCYKPWKLLQLTCVLL
jgi:hypothetical protein